MTEEELAAQTAADAEAADKAAAEQAAADAVAPAPAPKGKLTQARVLMDCDHGKANDVVSLSAADLKAAEAAGQVDGDKAAVKYALGLKQA